MRTTILGLVGVLWGGSIILSALLDRDVAPDAAHAAGELLAMAFGAFLLALGTRTLVRRFR